MALCAERCRTSRTLPTSRSRNNSERRRACCSWSPRRETSTMPPRRARILPFLPPRGSAPPGGPPPRRSPAGVVATLSIDAKEVARLVARDLADEWVKGLIADHQRRSGPPSSSAPVPCGAPRRHPPHAPCRSTGLLANGRCRWHQGPQCTAPGFLDSGLTVFASTPPRPARGGRVAPGPGFGSRTSPASTARCTSA